MGQEVATPLPRDRTVITDTGVERVGMARENGYPAVLSDATEVGNA